MSNIQIVEQVPGSCFRHVYDVDNQYAAQAMRMATMLTGAIDAKSQRFDLNKARALVDARSDVELLGTLDHTIHGIPDVLKPLVARYPLQNNLPLFGSEEFNGFLLQVVSISKVVSQLTSGSPRSPLTNAFVAAMDDVIVRELDALFGHIVSPQSAEAMQQAILTGFTNVAHKHKSAWIFYSDSSGQKATYQYNTFVATQSIPGSLVCLPIALTITVDVEHEEILGITSKDHKNFDVRIQAMKLSQPLNAPYTVAGHPVHVYPDQNCALAVGMTSAQYQMVVEQFVQSGYAPIYIDGATHYGQGFLNAVFGVWNGPEWYTFHQREASNFWTTYDTMVDQGFVLMQLTSYVDEGVQYFAGSFAKMAASNPRAAGKPLISATASEFQSSVDALVPRGYRIVCQSTALLNGVPYFSALFRQDALPFDARATLNTALYQQHITEMSELGWMPTNLDCYSLDDAQDAYFACVFNPVPPEARQTLWRHHLTGADLPPLIQQTNAAGMRPSLVSGYQLGSEIRYAAAWMGN